MDLIKKQEENEIEIEKLKIENEKNIEILIERFELLQIENKNLIEKTEIEKNEKETIIKNLLEEVSKIEKQNKILKSATNEETNQEFKKKYDSFLSEQDLQFEIKNLNERIEQYTKGIMKVQNKHVREMDRLTLENEMNEKNLKKKFEIDLNLMKKEMIENFEKEKNEIIENFEIKLKLMKSEYENDINIVKSQRDSMQMTLEEYKIDNLNGNDSSNKNQKKQPIVLSSKAKTLLMGDNDGSSNSN